MSQYLWLIPFFPLVSSFILIIFGRWFPRKYVSIQAPLAVLLSFVFGLASFLKISRANSAHEIPILSQTLFSWIHSGTFQIDFTLWFDPLTAVMVLVVTGVGFIIHVYSIGYMAEDKSYTRYFGLLNLFTFAMLLLVMAGNLVVMFVGWEGVGLCSYLLIGFWFEKPAAATAGKKAFIVNRIGDAAFLVGLFFLIFNLKTASFPEINQAIIEARISPALATIIALLFFAGATGKSAQIPLYVWLPDAMEGPTPVSALIHAATMVTAGVYMVSRLNLLYNYSGIAGEIVAIIGGLTAFYAGTIALTQFDLKRVLAYSTTVSYTHLTL
ncbi:MAG: proton-conducting transporter membrane subunit, partial [Candidatus Aminicenantes bacterium]|nr:proton-conducting transporter membrane subunit [Candidatus Aminicenantes bacterium]